MTASDKATLRRSMSARRRDLTADVAAACADAAGAHAARALLDAGARTIALYSPIPGRGEMDTAPLAGRLAAAGCRTAYPRVVSREAPLAFHDTAALAPAGFGVPEPAAHSTQVPLAAIDAFVVPMLAFDDAGQRVGWGAGHYDRTLAAAPHALRLGLAYAFQRVAEIPATPLDEPLDAVATESGLAQPLTPRQRRQG